MAKIDRTKAKKIKDKIEIFGRKPTEYGKPLTDDLKGLWSYRFSKYRVIY